MVAVRGDGGLRDHDDDDGEQWAGVQAAGRGPLPLPAASCEPSCPAPSCPAPAAAAAHPQPGDEYKTAGMSHLSSSHSLSTNVSFLLFFHLFPVYSYGKFTRDFSLKCKMLDCPQEYYVDI